MWEILSTGLRQHSPQRWRELTELGLKYMIWLDITLTCLICGYIYRHILPGSWTQVGHSIHCLNLKGIVCVSEQVHHHDRGVFQADLLGEVPDMTSTLITHTCIGVALLACNIIWHIFPSTSVSRRNPFQKDTSFINIWDGIPRRWGGSWFAKKNMLRKTYIKMTKFTTQVPSLKGGKIDLQSNF